MKVGEKKELEPAAIEAVNDALDEAARRLYEACCGSEVRPEYRKAFNAIRGAQDTVACLLGAEEWTKKLHTLNPSRWPLADFRYHTDADKVARQVATFYFDRFGNHPSRGDEEPEVNEARGAVLERQPAFLELHRMVDTIFGKDFGNKVIAAYRSGRHDT